MRNKALKAIICFFALMAALTLISRAADNMTLASVKTSQVGSGPLTHESQKEGAVNSASVTPVWASQGLRISEVRVKIGESVEKGGALIYYERDNVETLLKEQNISLQKLESERSSATLLEQKADMLIKQRALDDAQAAADKARGSKNKKEAAKKLERAKEDFAMADEQWKAKIAAEEKRLAAVESEAVSVEKRIAELRGILKDNCALLCPFEAIVVGIKAEQGALTGSEACLTLAPKDSALIAEVAITEDEAKYVRPSDKAQALPVGQREWRGASVISVGPASNGSRQVLVSLDEGDYAVGETVQVKFSKKTDSYGQCVPLSALYGDSSGDYLLSVVDTRSVLGDTQTLKRVSVTVIDRDSSRAAVTGAVTRDDEIVVKSDKAVNEGSRVRVAE